MGYGEISSPDTAPGDSTHTGRVISAIDVALPDTHEDI
jgi:hypothetical protein